MTAYSMTNQSCCIPEEGKEHDLDADQKVLFYRIHSIIKTVALDTPLYNQSDWCVCVQVANIFPRSQQDYWNLVEMIPFTATFFTNVMHTCLSDLTSQNMFSRMLPLLAQIANQYRVAWTPIWEQQLDGELTRIVHTLVTRYWAYISNWDSMLHSVVNCSA